MANPALEPVLEEVAHRLVQTRVPIDDAEQLEELAKQQDRSVASVVRGMIHEALLAVRLRATP